MKTIVLLLALSCLTSSLSAQCNSLELLEQGRALAQKRDFRAALNRFNAARICNPALASEVGKEIDQIFLIFDRQRADERRNRMLADERRREAEQARRIVEAELAKSDSAYRLQTTMLEAIQIQRARAGYERLRSDSLARRGAELLHTLTGDRSATALDELTALAYRYFAFDTTLLGRNYAQASVYFALARFIAQDSVLSAMVTCSNDGQAADRYFFLGRIDSAELLYAGIYRRLAAVGHEADYERRQLERLSELRALLRHAVTEGSDTLVLDGNWWTIPPELFSRRPPKVVVLQNNYTLQRKLPESLLRQPGIEGMIIRNCPRFAGIDAWGALSGLRALRIEGNAGLRELTLPASLVRLGTLQILRNPELSRIRAPHPLPALENVEVNDNFRLARTDSLFFLPHGRMLAVRASPLIVGAGDFLTTMPQLETLHLSQVSELLELNGCGQYDRLRHVEVSDNPRLGAIGGFKRLPALDSLRLSGNPRLRRLKAFRIIPSVRHLAVTRNERLHHLPAWRGLDSLHRVTIRANPALYDVGRWTTIKKAPWKQLDSNDLARHYVTFRVNRHTDVYSDDFFPPFYTFGVDYFKESIHRYVTMVFGVDYLRHVGEFGRDTSVYLPYYRAVRTLFDPVTGNPLPAEIVQYHNGRERFDLHYLDVRMLGKLYGGGSINPARPNFHYGSIVLYVLAGPTLRVQLPGRVSSEVDGSGILFEKRLKVRAEPYAFLALGSTLTANRLGVDVQFGVSWALGRGIERNSQRSQFYSTNGKTFTTTPVGNAFVINYSQPTYNNYTWFSLGLTYRLNYFDPFLK